MFTRLICWLPAALSICTTATAATPSPPVLRALTEQGLEVVGELDAPKDMKGYAVRIGTRSAAVYVTPDGKHAIAGTLFDEEGTDLTSTTLQETADAPLADAVWKSLESAAWIQDGAANAPRIVYVFTDPNCPYCAQFWAQARPWVDSGKVQLRHVMVGIISATSRSKAAALLSAPKPEKTFLEYERWHAQARGASAKSSPINEMKEVPREIAAKIDHNEALMREWQLQATPTAIWRGADGKLNRRTGIAPGMLEEVLGPRP